jgi:hypothetical protein
MKAEEDAGGGKQQEVGGLLWIQRCFVSQRVKARPRYTETCGLSECFCVSFEVFLSLISWLAFVSSYSTDFSLV